MAKFCTQCGKPLEEGEICACQQQGQYQQTPQAGGQDQGETVQVIPTAEGISLQKPEDQYQGQTGQGQYQQTQSNEAQYQGQHQQAQPNSDQHQGQFNQGQYQQAQPNGGQNENQQQYQQQYQQAKAVAAGLFAKASGCLINLYTRPVSTARSMIETVEFQVGLVFIVLQGIFSALFGMLGAGKIIGLVASMGSLFGLSSKFLSSTAAYQNMFRVPYFRIFIVTLLISVALSMVLALLLMAGNMVLKNRVSFQGMVAAASVRSAVLLATTVVAMLAFLINPFFGIIVFFAGNIWGIVLIALAMPVSNPGAAEKLPLVLFLVFLIFMLVSLFVMSKGCTQYLPDMLREGGKSLPQLDDVFDSLF